MNEMILVVDEEKEIEKCNRIPIRESGIFPKGKNFLEGQV